MPKTLLQEVNSQLNISLAPMYGVTDFTTRLFIFLLSSCDKAKYIFTKDLLIFFLFEKNSQILFHESEAMV